MKKRWKRRAPTQYAIRMAQPQPDPASAVLVAEQIVHAAWLGELICATEAAEATVRACLHLREQTFVGLRSALEAGDTRQVIETEEALASVQQALSESEAMCEGLQELLARERAAQPFAQQVRIIGA